MAKSPLSAKLFLQLDTRKLVKAMDRKERKVLYRSAAYARTTMKRGMRRRKKASGVGDYPSAHSSEIRDTIAFAVNPSSGASIVGPLAFSKQPSWLPSGITTVPQLLNEGGTVRRIVKKKTQIQRYKPRPFVDLTTVVAAKRLAENMKNIPLGV